MTPPNKSSDTPMSSADELNQYTATQGCNKTLINEAVKPSSFFSKKGLADRLFAKWFNRLVYPQIWEDPEVDIQALDLKENSRVFTISSGGCNVLNYLTVKPKSITVVDLNEHHLALLELKLIASQNLTQSEFFDFFANANLKSNITLFNHQLASKLSPKTQQYWNQRTGILRKRRIELFANHFYHQGLLGKFIGLIHWVSRRLGYDISQVMQAKTFEEQTTLFEKHVAPVFETRLLRFLSRRTSVLYSLGIPPSQYNEMQVNSEQKGMPMHELLKDRARRLACDFPLEENYFAWQAFARQYDLEKQKALPRYLKAEYFETIAQESFRVSWHHKSLTNQLQVMPANSLDAYLFLDAQDWMDEEQLNALWSQVSRTAAPGARVVFRTAGEISPLEEKLAPNLLEQWQTDSDYNQLLTRQDRSAIYGAVFMYQKITEQKS